MVLIKLVVCSRSSLEPQSFSASVAPWGPVLLLLLMQLYPHRDRTDYQGCGALDGHLDFHTVQCCFTSTETIRTIRDGEPRTATSTFTQLLSSEIVQCCFTSTETIKTIRDGEPRTATSTFTQLLNFEIVQCCFTSTETIKTIRDGEPRTATSSFTQLRINEILK